MFCAPRPMPELSSMAETAEIDMKGGHNTFSTLAISRRGALNFATRSRASATVLFIFQFPATMGVRLISNILFKFISFHEKNYGNDLILKVAPVASRMKSTLNINVLPELHMTVHFSAQCPDASGCSSTSIVELAPMG